MRKKIVYPLTASGGGSTPESSGSDLYIHTISFSNNATGSSDNGFAGIFQIINSIPLVMTQDEIRQWVLGLTNEARIMATGMYVDGKPTTYEHNLAYLKRDNNNFYVGAVSVDTSGNSFPRFVSVYIGTINDITFIDNDHKAPYKIQ